MGRCPIQYKIVNSYEKNTWMITSICLLTQYRSMYSIRSALYSIRVAEACIKWRSSHIESKWIFARSQEEAYDLSIVELKITLADFSDSKVDDVQCFSVCSILRLIPRGISKHFPFWIRTTSSSRTEKEARDTNNYIRIWIRGLSFLET